MTSITSQQYKSEEDVVNIDTMAQCERNTDASDPSGGEQPMILSKKALHQRDADENLFLRFLELDPPSTEAAPNSSSASTAGNNNLRRLSNTNTPQTASKFIGRTPFTMTKRLTRTAERGFGFSIVWTHPPRVEKVEPGLSADRKGILPGDYVIFVDKHNVVTMPEADVLNLIRSQGSTLTLEIFRRQAGVAGTSMLPQATTYGMNGKATGISCTANDEVLTITTTTTTANVPSIKSRQTIVSNNIHHNNNNYNNNNVNVNINSSNTNIRPSTVCSVGTSSSVEAAKRRLNLPQVTFSKESIVPITDNRRRFLLQLISREQNFISALHFGMHRFVQPLQERKDLMTPNDHRTLFQNIDELLRISEDILEQLSNDGHEPQMNFASRVYLSKTMAICAAYKKYCNGIKRADCILVNKSRQGGSEFLAFINEPPVPRKRPDLTMFIHRPLQHFREILKLMQMLVSNCLVDSEEYKNFMSVLSELQAAYREITVSSGLMEPLCEGRPLLTLQDLESRMVFTKCKPFTLAVQGRQWIFGGDLTRVEGRSMKPYWTLLFSDIIVFAKVSRDRVLFITEEPVPIANIVDSCFNMRKKTTEFRLTVDPNGRLAESPTGYCAPDLSRTPKKGSRRKSLILRAPSLELKAVWQNLLQRQIFLVNAALGSTPLSSPLDSPDVLNTLVPLSDIGFASTSISSIKIPSMDSINLRNQQTHHIQQPQQPQQVRLFRQRTIRSDNSYENLQRLARALAATHISTRLSQTTQEATSCSQLDSPARTHSPCMLASGTALPLDDCVKSVRSCVLGRRQMFDPKPICATRAYNHSSNNSATWLSCSGSSLNTQTLCSGDHLTNCKCLTAIPETVTELSLDGNGHTTDCCHNNAKSDEKPYKIFINGKTSGKLVDFNLSSVGRSFIDESDLIRSNVTGNFVLHTPDTPTLVVSPTCKSEAFSNDFVPIKQAQNLDSVVPLAQFEGSWDLIELDLNLHEVNLDPNYDTDVEEFIFHGDEPDHKSLHSNRNHSDDEDEKDLHLVVDDPFGILPTQPTPPDSLDL